MELNLEPPRSENSIRRVADDTVVVGSKPLHDSFVVTPNQLIEGLAAHAVDDIDQQTIDQLLALEPLPEVILLGSGPRQHFAPARVRARFLEKRIGLECMDNAACARTFNLLVNEGRHVAAAFLIP